MSNNTSIIEKIGIGKLIILAALLIFFIFQPDVFHYLLVATLICFPIYILLNKWLDSSD